jgi:hypothetical protein
LTASEKTLSKGRRNGNHDESEAADGEGEEGGERESLLERVRAGAGEEGGVEGQLPEEMNVWAVVTKASARRARGL